jgi:hypothetical protein
MVFPQKVNWFILYQSADKMASILLGLAHAPRAPIFLEGWLGVNESVKGIYGNLSAFQASHGKTAGNIECRMLRMF